MTKVMDAEIVEEYETRAIRRGNRRSRSWQSVEQNIKPAPKEIIEGEILDENN